MYWLDWMIVVIPLFVVLWIGFKTQKYVKGVSDFLTAGRVAGRYVLCVAGGEAGMGLISLVAIFEMYYSCGFGVSFWSRLTGPLGLIFALTGYCSYRFRETRAMTMGQFLEMRYNRAFRLVAAVLQSISGILNYAIFPAVGARFLIYFLDLPLTFHFLGLTWQTFGVVIAIALILAVVIVTLGGQITIMVTDCVQGILSYPMYVVIVAFVLYKFSWSGQMAPALLDRAGGESFLNPYDVDNLREFNLFYVVVGIFSSIINRMSWSGSQGYNAAAATPHEQKIGGLLGSWRSGFSFMMYILIAVAAYTYLNHSAFIGHANIVNKELAVKTILDVTSGHEFDGKRESLLNAVRTASPRIAAEQPDAKKGNPSSASESAAGKTVDNYQKTAYDAIYAVDKKKAQTFTTIFQQMRVPLAIREMLPIGITGVFCALMIFLMVSTDTTYMHSWGSILVQDIILPIYGKPFQPKTQLRMLRFAIIGVAVFSFVFSFWFSQLDYILMFFAITGAIWLGGAGPCIVFGLYWRRGTTAGAFASLLSGAILSVGGILCQNYWVDTIYPWLAEMEMLDHFDLFCRSVTNAFGPYIVWEVTPKKFPINSQEIFFIAMVVSIVLYVGISLLTCRKPFNLEQMLHRGIYSDTGKVEEKQPITLKSLLAMCLGITSEYSKGDKILAWSVFIYSFVWGFILNFVVIVIWCAISPWPVEWWAHYFYITNVLVAGVIGVISTVWFTIGGTVDLVRLFKRLSEKEEDSLDDGRVIGHVSASDAARMSDIDKESGRAGN